MTSLDTAQIWLTREALDRVKDELVTLIEERRTAAADDQDIAGELHRELRIRRLQDLIQNALVQVPADDGVAEQGMVVTVRFEGEDVTETYLLAEREESAVAGVEICTPHSPLGRALSGAVAGDEREFVTPDRRRVKVTVLRARPMVLESGRRRVSGRA